MPSFLERFMNLNHEDYREGAKLEIARKAIEEMSKVLGKFLNEELDDNEHTVDQVKAIIELFPESLSQVGGFLGILPIQNAAMSGAYPGARTSVSFIPLMAREGCRLGVGGEGKRGGLLLDDVNNYKMIHYLAGNIAGPKGQEANEHDHKRVQVLEELRNLNLLMKDDVKKYRLILCSLDPRCRRRFEFFTKWNPQCLKPRELPSNEWPPIHYALDSIDNKGERFGMALKAGMKYFPKHLGFLFCKFKRVTAIKKAFDRLGVDTAMNIIRKCIPSSDNHLILHRAVQHTPDIVNDISQYYPDAVFLRDTNGHTLLQYKFYISLRKGRRTFKKQCLFFLEATDDQVSRVDPKTGLCPFMLAAADNNSDLTAVYYLLSRNPKLIGLNEKEMANDCNEAVSSRKRRRGDFVK